MLHEVRDEALVLKYQKTACNFVRNELISRYYKYACAFAMKYLDEITYSNLISYEAREIDSIVYLVFFKCLQTYKQINDQTNFEKYLFQLIRFELLKEIRTNFKFELIPNYKFISQNATYDFSDGNLINETKLKIEKIINFLKPLNVEFAVQIQMRSEGYSISEIAKKLNKNKLQVKNQFQYIKKILINKFNKSCNL